MALGSISIEFIAQHTMVSFLDLFLKIHYLLSASSQLFSLSLHLPSLSLFSLFPISLGLSHNIAFHLAIIC